MLWFQLPYVFQPETTRTISLQYSMALPQIEPTNPNLTRPRIFGYSQHQINLTNWYPFVVPYVGGKWVLHDPWYYGEHLVYDAADFTVTAPPTDSEAVPVSSAVVERASFTRDTVMPAAKIPVATFTVNELASWVPSAFTYTPPAPTEPGSYPGEVRVFGCVEIEP